jgi:hypothetical protein
MMKVLATRSTIYISILGTSVQHTNITHCILYYIYMQHLLTIIYFTLTFSSVYEHELLITPANVKAVHIYGGVFITIIC